MKRLIFVALFTITASAFAQDDPVLPFVDAYKRAYHITKVSAAERPALDGRLDENFWNNQGDWSTPFVQVSPLERHPTEFPTRAKLLFDDKYLYIAIHCADPEPEKINLFIDNRDANNVGDLVSIAFDTYHDYRAAPEFNLNAGGNKTDLIVTDKLEVNRSWNAVWEAKTYVDKENKYWSAEIRVPFSQLRYNQFSEEGIWGVHIRRIIRRVNEVQNWSLIPVKNNGHVFSFGELHGMKDLPKPRGIEILPYVMGKYKNEPKIQGSPYQKGSAWNGNAGLDAKFALSDFTLDVAVNPDFGQVELDPSVMNLTAYETFYDEKRPFFLEGKHIMDFNFGGNMLFYTRRIGANPKYSPEGIDNVNSFADTRENVPIIGALKLTGTNKHGLTLGIAQNITAKVSNKVTRSGVEDKVTVEPFTNYTVARVQKNWQGNTLLGGMFTSVNRDLGESHLKDLLVENALAAGVDFTRFFNNRLYYIDFKGMYSYVNGSEAAIERLQRNSIHYYQRPTNAGYLGVDPTRTSLAGTGGSLKIGRKGNARWTFENDFSWSSPGFEINDVGYLRNADVMENQVEVAFKQTQPWSVFRTNTITLQQDNYWNYNGEAIDNSATLQWTSLYRNRFETSLSSRWNWNNLETRRLYGGPDFRFEPGVNTTFVFNTDKAKRIVFTLTYKNNTNSNEVNRSNTITPNMSFRLGNHLLLTTEFSYIDSRDNFQYVATLPTGLQSAPTDWIMGCIDQKTYSLTLKAQANITPDLSLQFYGAPYTSTGKYSDFKAAADTKSGKYENRFHSFTPEEINLADNTYQVNRANGASYSFSNPNFTFNEFRSNLVIRWEYRPGSTLYLVWEHTMSNRDNYYTPQWNNNLNRMFGLPASNVFMVKLNYWINI